MNKTTCVNCGKTISSDAVKCPHCGTAYLDFTNVNLDGETPCVLRFKIPNDDNIVQAVARPELGFISLGAETTATDVIFHTTITFHI